MRLDKFLKVSRVIKRRTVSKDLIEASHVYVNDKLVKPAYTLKINDIVEIRLGNKYLKIKIKQIKDFSSKEDAQNMYEVIEESFKEK